MKTSSMYLFAAVAVACVAFGSALKCHQCAYTDDKCQDPLDEKNLPNDRECEGYNGKAAYCVKLTRTYAETGHSTVRRMCGDGDPSEDEMNSCMDTDSSDEHLSESSCKCNNEDLCNGANGNAVANVLVFAASVVLAKICM